MDSIMDSSHQGGMVSEELQRGAVERTSGWRVVARWQRARCETPSLLYVQSVQNVTHSWARVPVRYPDAGERPQCAIPNPEHAEPDEPAVPVARDLGYARILYGAGSPRFRVPLKSISSLLPLNLIDLNQSRTAFCAVCKSTPLVITRAQP